MSCSSSAGEWAKTRQAICLQIADTPSDSTSLECSTISSRGQPSNDLLYPCHGPFSSSCTYSQRTRPQSPYRETLPHHIVHDSNWRLIAIATGLAPQQDPGPFH